MTSRPQDLAWQVIDTNLRVVNERLRRLAEESEGERRALYRRAIVANERTRALLKGSSTNPGQKASVW